MKTLMKEGTNWWFFNKPSFQLITKTFALPMLHYACRWSSLLDMLLRVSDHRLNRIDWGLVRFVYVTYPRVEIIQFSSSLAQNIELRWGQNQFGTTWGWRSLGANFDEERLCVFVDAKCLEKNRQRKKSWIPRSHYLFKHVVSATLTVTM